MSTITKERIANLLQFNSEGSDCQANAEQWEVHELARIALASLEAEPVSVQDERYQHLSEIYHAQEKRLFKLAQRIKGESFDKYSHSPSQAIDVLESAIFGESAEEDSRAAMLQSFGNSEQLNSPVIPDGWVLVPEEPTHEMLEAGDEQFGTYDVYRRMIAASPQQK
ncbi:hypothetical protein N8V33_24950 [Enterobacter hormaechei subsp. steigerwaltii]|nr:hypothetical protein [Enterobacter hormaechei subsp. steigerwaltii]MCU3641701.1 hypothetical protein [Enterobacter hormaechei subsp. steigerwaltii]MCU3671302.1 hypothetical protein [Enterobacter hormaechei subsp. steigerwaltii]